MIESQLRNLILGGLLLGSALATGLLIPAGAASSPTRAASRPPLALELAALVQRETAAGGWSQISSTRPRADDQLQLTVRVSEPAFLLVAFATNNELQLAYPLAGQTGEVRGDWGYALPDPHRSYTLDGRPTRVLAVASRDPLPGALQERLALLRSLQRRGATAPAAAPGVQLELRDGAPVSVPVRRFTADASPAVGMIDL